MQQLSEHFSLEEATFSSTAIRKGIENVPPPEVLANMQAAASKMELVRNVLGFPIHVDSWYRCLALNLAVGGSEKSAHMTGWAIDFICPAFGTPAQIAKLLMQNLHDFDQIIMEGTWVHISFAPENRRQVLTAHFAPTGTTYTEGLV